MITEIQICIKLKEAECRNNKKKRFPASKDWENYYESILPASDKVYVQQLQKFFNTKWLHANIDDYFDCGFEIYTGSTQANKCPECGETLIKGIDRFHECIYCGHDYHKQFCYSLMLRPKIYDLYIKKDKIKKRKMSVPKKTIEKSFDFIRSKMKDKKIINGYTLLQTYCKLKEGSDKVILADYMRNFVDPLIVVYCIYYKYLKLTDIEREYAYNVSNRYRDLLEQMFEIEDFIKEQEAK